MKVLKFGGSSLADADCFKNVAEIIDRSSQKMAVATVVSAPKGITDALVLLIDGFSQSNNEHFEVHQQAIEAKFRQILDQAYALCSGIKPTAINQEFDKLMTRFSQLSRGAELLNYCPEPTVAQILSTGEKFSVLLLSGFLESFGHQVSKINPEKFLTITDQTAEPIADLILSKSKFHQSYGKLHHLSLMPGFFGVKQNGETTTLGRNGSDYSAAILAVCMDAELCEVWTDVDGVYNSDPNLVDGARLLEKMSYREAIELSYFGSKILHPKTIAPLLQYKIPCKIKNTHAPEKRGTLISLESGSKEMIKAVTNLSNVAMVTVSGPDMAVMTSRVFSSLSQADISIIMISQSSAEYSISFCVSGKEVEAARRCLNKAFYLELKNELLEPISIRKNLAIITLVGDRMQHQRGIAAKFFSALSQARVNIIAIAQDSSERSISAVVRAKRVEDAVKICHQKLFVNKPLIDAIIIGCGTIGTELIDQICRQQKRLDKENIVLNVVGIANSKRLLLVKGGIDLGNWKALLNKAETVLNLDNLKDFVADAQLSNPVIVDCTSDNGIAMQYNDYLSSGFHLVTANKKANTASFEYYCQIRKTAKIGQRRFLYETNVGAGLPVIDNLQGLLRAGDELLSFEGILSGSLSYIFGEIHNGRSLYEATKKARELKYTEPNPAEDLSGLDVARKVLVIARESGLALELEDVSIEGVVPIEIAKITNPDEFMEQLQQYDQEFAQKVIDAEQKGLVLRYIASISDNKITVGIQAVGPAHPLYSVCNGENALSMNTRYYQPIPFVIRGYGAGAEVTAAGLFGDLLKTLPLDQQP